MLLRKTALPLVLGMLSLAAACDNGTGGTPVDTVIIEAESSELAVGETLELTATAYDDRGNEITGRETRWTVSDRDVATIDDQGMLTGVSEGSVQVTAEIGGERDVQTFDVLAPQVQCDVATYTLGATATGTPATSDCRFEDGTYLDLYQLTVSARRQVVITLRSSDFDAFLLLYSAAGPEITRNDNGGGGTDARITVTLDPSTYLIAATSLDVDTGAYTLTSQ